MAVPSARRALAGALAAVLALAGCSGQRDTHPGRQIERVIKAFAAAHDARACNYLAAKSLKQVYGGDTRTKAYAACVKASKRFKGEQVVVTYVDITSKSGAHATARTRDGRRYYALTLIKYRNKRWLISGINPEAKPG
jgi:hypothetical protein